MIANALNQLSENLTRAELMAAISDEIAQVEERLDDYVRSDVKLADMVAHQTLRAGGKRLRPAFVALAAEVIGNEFSVERTRDIGAGLEMIHMATLVHDDVIDGAATRRGAPTAATVFGNQAAILSGDVLLAKAMLILARDGDVKLIQSVSKSIEQMVLGEVRELEVRGDYDLSFEDHLEVLHLKTAAFIEGCLEAGAIIADATEAERDALRTYGGNIGLAFQIVDDLLDYRGAADRTGKPVGLDFRDGQCTMPLIFLRETLSPAEEAIVRSRFGTDATAEELRMIVDWMETRGAFQRAEVEAEQRVAAAVAALGTLKPSRTRSLLAAVGQYVLSRDH